ncbi:heterocyst-inhibiting protein PatX [Cylindrospermopsis curvispora]|uniref:heterocyst-inhibiting protein PatX n=1 Tax=Cylindrospermopsis curvispora TaxID=747548 RepID=UPI0038B2E15C
MILGSLAFHLKTVSTNPSRLSTSNSGRGLLLANSSKPSPNQPEEPAPHRGSGRKESIEFFGVISLA